MISVCLPCPAPVLSALSGCLPYPCPTSVWLSNVNRIPGVCSCGQLVGAGQLLLDADSPSALNDQASPPGDPGLAALVALQRTDMK